MRNKYKWLIKLTNEHLIRAVPAPYIYVHGWTRAYCHCQRCIYMVSFGTIYISTKIIWNVKKLGIHIWEFVDKPGASLITWPCGGVALRMCGWMQFFFLRIYELLHMAVLQLHTGIDVVLECIINITITSRGHSTIIWGHSHICLWWCL